MTDSASEAARHLASLLLDEQSNLDSDDITTIAASMASVRAAARGLESALEARGWGGGVLYGFGEPEDDDEDDESEFDVEEPEEDVPLPAAIRMTYQARHDFVMVDEDALATHIAGRMAEAGKPGWSVDEVIEHGTLLILAQLDGFGAKDYSSHGLVYGGGQDATHAIPATLWEMDSESSDDQFPTSTL